MHAVGKDKQLSMNQRVNTGCGITRLLKRSNEGGGTMVCPLRML